MQAFYQNLALGNAALMSILTKDGFYLTGSRFFENSDDTSDYDFFTTDSKTVREWLSMMGFTPIPMIGKPDQDDAGYNDSDIVDVFRNHKARVDVQLVHDVKIRLEAQQLLKSWKLLKNYPKDERSRLWTFALMIVRQRHHMAQHITRVENMVKREVN